MEKALQLDPENQQALWFAGIAAMEANEFKQALKHFLILQPKLYNNQQSLQQLHQLIARAEQNLSKEDIEAVASEVQVELPPASTAEIQVTVSLDDSMMSRVSGNDVVFVYAKAMSGPSMPLAAVKQPVSSLPMTVTLNDSMAMMPAMKLSAFEEVIVGAKISKSGNAGASSGDLFDEVTNVKVGTDQAVSLVINKVKS